MYLSLRSEVGVNFQDLVIIAQGYQIIPYSYGGVMKV